MIFFTIAGPKDIVRFARDTSVKLGLHSLGEWISTAPSTSDRLFNCALLRFCFRGPIHGVPFLSMVQSLCIGMIPPQPMWAPSPLHAVVRVCFAFFLLWRLRPAHFTGIVAGQEIQSNQAST